MQSEDFTTIFRTAGQEAKASSGDTARYGTAASVLGVSKRYRGTVVLDDINFDLSEGEAVVLLGASGSGKTTILRIIAGLEEPDTGSIFLHGKDVTELPARERGVGVIFQSYALFPRMSVEQNIGYGLRIRHRPRAEVKKTVDDLVKLVRLEEHRKKFPSQLSGGQQQRVAIARTLAYKPQVLLFDEPFGALDAQTRVRLRREIRALLKQVNVPAIFITHDQEEALELGDRVAVLNAGRLEQIGTPDEVYNRPATEFVATFLGTANILLGVVNGEGVEIGTVRIPAREETAGFKEGQAVKLVFRPEDVCVGKTEALALGCQRLTNGVVEEIHFVGAYERLTLRLNLIEDVSDGNLPRLYSVTVNTNEKRMGVPISVTRSKPEANATPLKTGDRVAVGLTAFRVLPTRVTSKES